MGMQCRFPFFSRFARTAIPPSLIQAYKVYRAQHPRSPVGHGCEGEGRKAAHNTQPG
jgi:hypothetical protein